MIAYSQDFCHGEKCNVQISYLTIFLICRLVDRLHPQKCDSLIKDHCTNKKNRFMNMKKKSFSKYKTCHMNNINITMMHVVNNSIYKKNQISQLDCIYKFEQRKQFN
jgi:hypothetical protein